MVRTPSFFKSQMTTDVFVEHYTRVADASPVPVLLYNVTMFTGVNLPASAVETLAGHPNIAGMKESGSDIGAIGELVERTPEDFVLLAGSATTFFHALCAGCDGGVLALASLVPGRCVELQTLVRQNRIDDARRLQRDLMPLARLIGGQHGVSGLKAAMDVAGYEGGHPRPPLRPVGRDVIDALRGAWEALQGMPAIAAGPGERL
jgi:4-hydroxy-2-oxoglutarate aldolase